MKTLRIISASLLFFVGINALLTGGIFLFGSLGINASFVREWMWLFSIHDFLIPFTALLIVDGLLNLLTASGVIFRRRHFHEFIIIQGMILLIWPIITITLGNRFQPLDYLFAVTGCLLMAIGIRIQQLILNF